MYIIMKKIGLLFSLLLVLTFKGQCQEEYLSYDYFSHNYKYLDDKFKITSTDSEFKKLIIEINADTTLINTYKDSLWVIMKNEFDDDNYVRVATNRIGMDYERLGLYLWLLPRQCEELAFVCGYEHPYKFYHDIKYSRGKWSKNLEIFMDDYKQLVFEVTGNEKVIEMSTAELISYALRENPIRKNGWRLYVRLRKQGYID